jgi:hypothetical protein
LTVAGLQHLLAPHEPPCISIFMPTHRQPQRAREDQIRLKNLLGRCEELLNGHSSRTRATLLEPLRRLVEQGPAGERLDGLALFRSPDVDLQYRLAAPLPERVVVAKSFHIRPLIRYLQSNRRYYVLALSQNRVTLYEGTASGLAEKPFPDVPESLEAVLERDYQKGFLNFHSVGGGGNRFHGQGTADERKKDDLTVFFRAVDEALWQTLRDEHAPLVLAGVGYYHPIYRSLCRYQYLAAHGVEGNFEHVPAAHLHARAWPLVAELFGARESAALDEFQQVRGRGLATDRLDDVARAAVQGRVRRLLVAKGAQVWGVFDRNTGAIERREQQTDAHDDDVVDDVAEAVLSRGGEVLMLAPGRLPSGSAVAAVLRW